MATLRSLLKTTSITVFLLPPGQEDAFVMADNI